MPSINFKGKSIVHSYHLTVPYRQVIPDEARSVLTLWQSASLKGNLILHGDNLHALKSLIPRLLVKLSVSTLTHPTIRATSIGYTTTTSPTRCCRSGSSRWWTRKT